MNRIKRFCALLLAVVLVLGVALQPGIGGVYAENPEQDEQIQEPSAEPITEPAEEPTMEPMTEPTLEPTAEPAVEPMAEPALEPAAEPAGFPWEGMTDSEFAAWLMDTANAETVKPFLTGGSEEYAALNARIATIADTALAERVKARLAELRKDAYIYFDLAAGPVTIGKETYTGWVYVAGIATKVTGSHKDDNKYYVYQSKKTNDQQTGYAEEGDYDNKTGCRVPAYNRVSYDGKLWTDYITNNTEVKTVSTNWDAAAADSGRTPTGNNITFTPASGYTANVTIDNIWSTYREASEARSTGGIGAHLGAYTDTKIHLWLKGDNRVSSVHYFANRETRNEIHFHDGETGDDLGSITVADFKDNWKGNHWCAAIGGNDSGCDRSDGIVIDGGVIYAGTTPEDNCTAIGGGGNEYGRVTINGGIVTAVTSGTGTAIGGGIGYGDHGGDTDVLITGGIIYAYNLGVQYEKGDKFEKFVPAAAIGGGGSKRSAGGLNANITIEGGTIYAQSMGGPGIGGGGSAESSGGPATITITGGTIIAKSISGMYGTETISAGASIGGGTGSTAGGSVTLTIRETDPEKAKTILRTGSIGGGKGTSNSTIGRATVTIEGGDITGQVVMAATGTGASCSFSMKDGIIHGTNVIDGNTIRDIPDPQQDVPVEYLWNNGGAVWMQDQKGEANISGGTIEGCTAELGGAIYMTGGTFTLSGTGTIRGNSAKQSGGAVYIQGGTANVTNGNVQQNKAGANGGGLYVTGGNVNVTGGVIQQNHAGENGGGVYLAKGEGDFTLEGETASISHNTAKNGGGVYLYKDPVLNWGRIESNNATENGGGMYISDCLVTLNPTNDVTITGNGAKNGAGIYIHGSFSSSQNTGSSGITVDAVTSSTPTQRVGLLVASGFSGTVSFTNNTATENGGAVCVDVGRFYLESDRITVTGNRAENGGGGVAVLHGNFTMSAGSIGEENGKNTATYGGGVYVSSGEVWLKGGSVKYNEATDGGGAYVTGGKMFMLDGSLEHNSATGKGGGAYVAGDFRMQGGTIGGSGSGNHATNGGGVYVNEGNVEIVYGVISHNHAEQDGGGFFISAASKPVKVLMLSGSLCDNEAGNNGGGMAVESKNDAQTISIEIGCLLDHNLVNKRPQYPIAYEGDYKDYAEFGGKSYQHKSCPQVKNNQAGKIGGGFYLYSNASTLSFFCVEETANIAQDEDSGGMDVLGGKVIIGDKEYHNHEYNEEKKVRPEGKPWGYISMDDATLVNGGQVDIYGDLTNPTFNKEIMVDIIDQNDHFVDHRRAVGDEKIYKVHYFENFQGTGRFESRDYHEGDTVITVKGAIFSHPGYKLLGWYTKPEYDPNENDPDNTFYEVGRTFDLSKRNEVPQMGQHATDCTHCGENHKDSNLLGLYAIWEANGYTVVFDPNVPLGDTYTGTMPDQILQYNLQQKLYKNQYQYPGHFFKGWNTKADGTGEAFTDEQEKIFNLTDQNGAVVTLYAQWDPCKHDDPARWTYEVTEDGKTLKRICSCGGQTLTATLYGEDTVYDGLPHPATLTFNDEAAWGMDKPTIVYTGERLKAEDTTKYGAFTFGNGDVPYHAGKYTATITKPGETAENKVTASVTYIIDKASQPAPSKPTYTVPDGTSNVVIDRLNDGTVKDKNNVTHTAAAEYRLSFYEGGVLKTTQWKKITDASTTITINMENAWTSYNVEARYEELEDYKASDVSRADAVYHYAGKVTVKIICDEGIEAYFDARLNATDKRLEGATLILKTKAGYYLVGGKYNVKAELMTTTGTEPVVPGNEAVDKYSFNSVPDGSTLTITIGTAKKAAQVQQQVTPGQVFRPITGTSATISRDSAFTAAFQISNYDPAVYTGLNLTFGSEIPAKTTIIMVDRQDGSYWYYRAASAASSVPLTAFKRMGGDGSYTVPAAEENGYIDLSYQFIVDFSQSAGCSADLTMTLDAAVKEPDTTKAPEIKPAVTVIMKNASFQFILAGADGLTNHFTCTFTKDATASKWENRASALILTPDPDANLPPDAQIKAELGGGTTYLYKSNGQFIVPLSLLQDGAKTVKLTLLSDLFPAEGKSYSFTAQWLISPSKASKAPMTGAPAPENGTLNVTFTSPERKAPSLKLTGQNRILTSEDTHTLELTIDTRNMDGNLYTISAELLHKSEDGTYSGTGWNKANITDQNSLSVPLGGQIPGSFCLMLTVKEKGSITTVMEVPYYFIIKPTQ